MLVRVANVAMFWRFASEIQEGLRLGVALTALNEAYDEIESILLHTQDGKLRTRCQGLLDARGVYRDAEIQRVPVYDDVENEFLYGSVPSEGYLA